MADINVSCPHCNQLITCDELWGGHELQCPSCQGAFVVPAPAAPPDNPLAPKPPAGPNKLPFKQQAQVPAQIGRDVPLRNLAPPARPKKNIFVQIATITAVVAGLGVGCYFGFSYVSSIQEKANSKRRQEERNADGGQVGHIANLYDVLDRTDPNRGYVGRESHASMPRGRPSGLGEEIPVLQPETIPGVVDTNLPVIAPLYTLDVALAKIPEGRINGMIAGTNFQAEMVRLDLAGATPVLRFLQGPPTSPDREILIYLHLKAGEKIGGQSLTISTEMRGSSLPSITKLWKPNPKFAPNTKPFAYGYAMKLEFGQPTDGAIPGKIFLALPDKEQSVIGGVFTAATPSVPDDGS